MRTSPRMPRKTFPNRTWGEGGKSLDDVLVPSALGKARTFFSAGLSQVLHLFAPFGCPPASILQRIARVPSDAGCLVLQAAGDLIQYVDQPYEPELNRTWAIPLPGRCPGRGAFGHRKNFAPG